jgi:hypothetical protein
LAMVAVDKAAICVVDSESMMEAMCEPLKQMRNEAARHQFRSRPTRDNLK